NNGRNNDGDLYCDGYIDELRISKGIARWTANFTVPSAPYSGILSIPPEISTIPNQTIPENTVLSAINFTVTDINEQALTITYDSSDESLISTSSIEFAGGNVSSNGTSYSVTATSEATVVTLMITPETDQSGFSFITITVTDSDGMSMSDSFSLTILGENL
ncbi:hypothetical protein MHK_002477, partial [Candidatus Magnetomorum sp. HK-1]